MTAEANAILQRQTAIVMAMALAKQRAIREVKRRRQKAGLRQSLSHAVLAAMATEYLEANPNLYAASANAMATPETATIIGPSQVLAPADRPRPPRGGAPTSYWIIQERVLS